MIRDWEETFSLWSQGPSKTETEKADNAVNQIKEAIKANEKLKNRSITVFSQGSYRNRVNVKKDSDVDIGVICSDTMFVDSNDENLKNQVRKNFSDSDYTYQTFKNELEEALVFRFGRNEVTRSDKAFDIKANTYRLEADVVAFFEHRRYTSMTNYLSGVELRTDKTGDRIINWPEQHYTNAVQKNDSTSRKFKRVVRVFKNLSNEMAEKGYLSAQKMPGFLLECLIWNVPNKQLEHNSYKAIIRECLIYLYNNTKEESLCSEWGEVSELKYLFRLTQKWTSKEVNQFTIEAWKYVGFE